MLQEVSDLGVTHDTLEGLLPVAHAHMLGDVGHQVVDARGGHQVLASHERSALDDAHARRQVFQAYPDPLD